MQYFERKTVRWHPNEMSKPSYTCRSNRRISIINVPYTAYLDGRNFVLPMDIKDRLKPTDAVRFKCSDLSAEWDPFFSVTQ